MKKVMMMASAVLMSAVCLAQVANVKKVQNIILGETPNYDEARRLINEAKENEETKNMANTWYVAGLIGYQESSNGINNAAMVGLPANYEVVGAAQRESYQCWLKADELTQILVQDKKGNMVMDKGNAKIRKNIAQKMLDYWTNQGLVQYGGLLSNQSDYANSYEVLRMYIDLPKLAIMQDPKILAKMVLDTNYQYLQYSTGRIAYSAEKYKEGVEIFSELVKGDYEAVNSGRYLYSCYLNMKDTAKAYEVIDMCIRMFPKETVFLQERTQAYIQEKNYAKALELLNAMIAKEPTPQSYNLKGVILCYQSRYDEAVEAFKQVLKDDMTIAAEDLAMYSDIYTNYGYYAYIERGNKLNDESVNIADEAEYNKVRKQIDELYLKAKPLLEKAYQLNKENYDCVRVLKSLYYRLGMMEEYNSL